MSKVIRIYVLILPFLLLLGIAGSISRTAFQLNFAREFLLILALVDFLVIIVGFKKLKNTTFLLFLAILSMSYFVGFVNENTISRRFITDGILPIFFIGKILILSSFWRENDFKKYIKYYSRVTFFGSLFFLPITYYLFNKEGVTRLAIFPPLELPFSNYMQSGGGYFIVAFLMIILYGKRAQLVGGVVTFVVFVFLIKSHQIVKYLIIGIISVTFFILLIKQLPNNVAVRRLSSTFEGLQGEGETIKQIEGVSAGRDEEIITVINLMDSPLDFILGKGIGFTYMLKGDDEVTSNIHFSPLSFLSKYGLLFTLFIYGYIMKSLIPSKREKKSHSYMVAYGTVWFVFIESFFSYALFVTPILPIVLGYLHSLKFKVSNAKDYQRTIEK